MHVTLTARKQRVYSKLVFKTYKEAQCNWLRKLSKRNEAFLCKAQCDTIGDGSATSTCHRTELAESNGGDGLRFASAPIG